MLPRFILFGSGRSGSSLLTGLLDSLPAVRCDLMVPPRHNREPRGWLALRSRNAGRDGAVAYGCRLQTPQLIEANTGDETVVLLSEIVANGWKVIWLRRASVGRTIISYANASVNGFHRYEGQQDSFVPYPMDLRLLEQWSATYLLWRAVEVAAVATVPHMELLYEQALLGSSRQQQTLTRIGNYVGFPVGTGRSHHLPVLPDRPLRELFPNYPDIEATLERLGVNDLHSNSPPHASGTNASAATNG